MAEVTGQTNTQSVRVPQLEAHVFKSNYKCLCNGLVLSCIEGVSVRLASCGQWEQALNPSLFPLPSFPLSINMEGKPVTTPQKFL